MSEQQRDETKRDTQVGPTPGPWKHCGCGKCGQVYAPAGDVAIAYSENSHGLHGEGLPSVSLDEMVANAHLIAAAPALLAAAGAWVEAHEEWAGRLIEVGILDDGRYGGENVPDHLWAAEVDAYEDMRAAIQSARARGEGAGG